MSAPSGTGKTSIIKRTQEILPQLVLSVSDTTRAPRSGEVEGVDYNFTSPASFQERIEKHEFLEWAEVHGNYYGTSKELIRKAQVEGKIVLLDIDVQGAMQIKAIKNIKKKFIFIVPPSIEILRERLSLRGTETAEALHKRLGNARHELSFQDQYDYVVVNDDLETAVKQFVTILVTESINPALSPALLLEKLIQIVGHKSGTIHPVLLNIYKQLLQKVEHDSH